MPTRGLPAAFLVIGEAIQSMSLGILERGDPNRSFATRAVGTLMISLGLAAGSALACLGSPLSEGLLFSALTVPVVRADLVTRLLSRIVHIFLWAGKLHPAKLPYAADVYPLQVAAIIWNDCAPVTHSRGEDDHTVVMDMLDDQRSLWRPSGLDSWVSRGAKAPLFAVLAGICAVVGIFEAALVGAWRLVSGRNGRHTMLVAVGGAQRVATGHTTLITDAQLTWIQDSTTQQGGDTASALEFRTTVIRALHLANLLGHGGHTRLHEHPPFKYAMSDYYQQLSNPCLEDALTSSSMDNLRVLQWCRNGNSLSAGKPAPRQVLWARLVVGSNPPPGHTGRWRGPVASALLILAQEHVDSWGAAATTTAVHRHVHTVLRRWLVDWTMFLWWDMTIPDEAPMISETAFFSSLRGLLEESLVHNTQSVPHAIGELAWSTQRTPEVERMLRATLGDEWHAWLQTATIPTGTPLGAAASGSGEWKCVGKPVDPAVAVDRVLYNERVLAEVTAPPAAAPESDQVRAVLAKQLVATLIARLHATWAQLPYQLLDPPRTLDKEAIP